MSVSWSPQLSVKKTGEYERKDGKMKSSLFLKHLYECPRVKWKT